MRSAAGKVATAARGTRGRAARASSGSFTVGNLTPGSGYTVSVTKSGFAQYERTHIEILLGQDVFLNVKLELVQVRTRMDVEGSPIVEANKTGLSQVVEN